MVEFLKNYGSRLILLLPLFWLSFDWLIRGRIIAFILTSIFIIVIFALWEDTEELSDEEE